jgi:TPR repeat protein
VVNQRDAQAAADAGDASAQFAIGVAHETGKTVPQDNALAFMWFCLAADKPWCRGGATVAM